MSYEKLTVKAFKEALSSGKYVSATAARRAIGKASTLSDEEKDQARKAVDAYFPGEAKEAAAPAKKAAKTAKAGKKADKSVRKAPERVVRVQEHSASIFGHALQANPGSLDDYTNLTVQVKLAEKTIQNAGSALGMLLEAKKLCPDAELTQNIESASVVLSSAVDIFRSVTHRVTNYLAESAKKETPHASSTPSNGKAVFEETSP